jgi:hypothetical protein
MDERHVKPYALTLAVAEGTGPTWEPRVRGFEGDSSREWIKEFKDDAG